MAEQTYGGFWIRFLAYLVDNVVLFTALFGLLFAGIFLGELWLKFMVMLCVIAPILYWGVMQGSARQATFGKALLGLKVTDESGNRLSLVRSFARELAKIVSAIPLMLGFVLAAFTGRKQALHDMIASTTVVRESPGHVLVGLIIGVFGWLAPVGLAMFVGGAILAVMLGTMGTSIFPQATKDSRKHVAVQTAPAQPAPKPALAPSAAPTPSAAQKPAAPSADVETLLAARLDGMGDERGMTRAGPAILHLDTLFGGSFWIKTYLPPLTELRGAKPTLSITRVLDSKDADLYDPQKQLESEFFQRVSLSSGTSPVPHLAGTRSVQLKSGASTSDLQRIEGTLKLDLPVKPMSANFTAADAGKTQTIHGNAITLNSLSEKQAELRVAGDWTQLVSVTGYGADEKPVPTGMGPGSGGAVKLTFQRPATRLEVMIAESRAHREFPFTLTRTSLAGPANAAAQAAATPAPARPASPAPKPSPTAVAPVAAAKPAAPPKIAETPAPTMAAAVTKPARESRVDLPGPIQPRTIDLPGALEALPGRPGPKYNDVMSAVMTADSAAVNELLALGRWADKPDSNGITPLTAAVRRGDQTNAELLLKAGADAYPALAVARERRDAAMTSLLERYLATSKRP